MSNGQFNLKGMLGGNVTKDLIDDAQVSKTFFPEITDVLPNEDNSFKVSEEHVAALAHGIEENGLLHDLIAYKEGNKYILLSGHCRLEAMKKILLDGGNYTYCGKDITGKVPVTLHKAPKSKFELHTLIREANKNRDLSDEEEQNLIVAAINDRNELQMQGKEGWPKGIQSALLISEDTGLSINKVKNYMARAGLKKGEHADAEKASEKIKQTEISESKKTIKTLRRSIKRLDTALTNFVNLNAEIDESEKEEITIKLLALVEHINEI